MPCSSVFLRFGAWLFHGGVLKFLVNIKIVPIHIIMLMAMLRIAYCICPVRNSSTVSKLKEEKVLKPPQKPITRKKRIAGEYSFPPTYNTSKPRIRQLKKLEINVAIGNLGCSMNTIINLLIP